MTRVSIILLIISILVLSAMAGMAGVTAASPDSSNKTTAEMTNAGLPATATEGTNANWTWLLLLAFIPLTGIVIYYFAFVREK
jgi:uncharacterized membrane protein